MPFGLDRGQDTEGPEMLTQGFTHSFSMTFDKKEDYAAFQSHPNHVEYSATFSAAIEKIAVLCFPYVRVKPAAWSKTSSHGDKRQKTGTCMCAIKCEIIMCLLCIIFSGYFL